VSENVWEERETTPAAVEKALRDLLMQRHAADEAFVPARVLNLVVVVDREREDEVTDRLDRVGRYHPSRTILCSVEEERSAIDARAAVGSEGEPTPGELALGRERVSLLIGERHLDHLDTIVDPLVVTDLATVVWAPHGHDEAVDALMSLAQVVLVDCLDGPDPGAALDRVRDLSGRSYVVDLAWLRTTPWRERIAATFDPPGLRDQLEAIIAVEVRHQAASGASALLVLGWLASRLGWEAEALAASNGMVAGKARAPGGGEVELRLAAHEDQDVPGLAGISLSTGAGVSLDLDRGPGGLAARRTTADGRQSAWTVLGASRGEAGILGEGIRQALLRDRTYAPALASALVMAP
jgi:glucose-6-phosphate dehydrogenase assembly protein OpcA